MQYPFHSCIRLLVRSACVHLLGRPNHVPSHPAQRAKQYPNLIMRHSRIITANWLLVFHHGVVLATFKVGGGSSIAFTPHHSISTTRIYRRAKRNLIYHHGCPRAVLSFTHIDSHHAPTPFSRCGDLPHGASEPTTSAELANATHHLPLVHGRHDNGKLSWAQRDGPGCTVCLYKYAGVAKYRQSASTASDFPIVTARE